MLFRSVDGTDPTPVLGDFSARIEPGESVARVGATGSGKSTLVALLAGMVSPTAGRVLRSGSGGSGVGVDGAAAVVAHVRSEAPRGGKGWRMRSERRRDKDECSEVEQGDVKAT